MNIIPNETGWLPNRRRRSPFDADFWDDFFEPFGLLRQQERGAVFNPKIDVKENDKEIKVKAELPGLTQDQVSLNLTEESLEIKGEKLEEKEDKDEKGVRHYVERTYGAFSRTIPLRVDIDRDKIDASFKNGVLTVTLPKSTKAREKVKNITISSE